MKEAWVPHSRRSFPGSPPTGLRRWGGVVSRFEWETTNLNYRAIMALQLAEKLTPSRALCQGTTSEHAEKLDSVKGTGFSPCISPAKSMRALAPEGSLSGAYSANPLTSLSFCR